MRIHQAYGEMSDAGRKVVDEAFEAVKQVLYDNGIQLAFDDRAEYLVEAIAKYIKESEK